MVLVVEGWGRTAYGWDRSTWGDTLLGYFGEFSDVLCTALDGHMQYYTFSSSLSIPSPRHPPLLYGLIGEGAGRWVQVASHLTRSHSHSLPNKPDQVPDLYMKYKRTRTQHARRPRSYELPPLKK